jgi:hypothetical protein
MKPYSNPKSAAPPIKGTKRHIFKGTEMKVNEKVRK